MKTYPLTKQGIRNLGHSKRRTPPEMPPVMAFPQSAEHCPHLHTVDERELYEVCRDCGKILERTR